MRESGMREMEMRDERESGMREMRERERGRGRSSKNQPKDVLNVCRTHYVRTEAEFLNHRFSLCSERRKSGEEGRGRGAEEEEEQSVEEKMGEQQHITRVLFCDLNFPFALEATRHHLQPYPFIQVDAFPCDKIADVIQNFDLSIVLGMRLDSEIIARANQMKLIMQYGVGLEGVDIDAATKYGIKVARIPSGATGNATSCAEMAIYLMLGLLRKQNEMRAAVKQKILGAPTGETLLGKSVLIMGFGHIGISLAKRLRPFGVKILATKRSWDLGDSFQSNENGNTTDDLVDEKGFHSDIFKFAGKADIVVCCLRQNKETVGVVDQAFLSSMRKGALLINIARAGLLDYDAVLCSLKSGHLGGLGTDVAWSEPLDPDDPILKFQNVILTPHVAGVTKLSYGLMGKVVADVALQLHDGAPLTGIEIVN